LNKPDLQPPADIQDKVEQPTMQQWRDAALNSADLRDRIAVTGGLSRGVFGNLHLGCSHDTPAANDSDFNDEQLRA